MTEKPVVRTTIASSDLDAQGMVVVWDRGPQKLDPEPKTTYDDRKTAWDAEVKAWKALYGDGSAATKMHANDAVHAIQTDPNRYSLDPIDDEAAIAGEVKKIQDAREAAQKADTERAKVVQLAADRQQAVANLMAARKTAAAAPKPVAPVPPSQAHPVTV